MEKEKDKCSEMNTLLSRVFQSQSNIVTKYFNKLHLPFQNY